MNILVSWKESLKVFLPNNFKILLFVSLKSFVATLKILIKQFWWLYGLCLGIGYVMWEHLVPRFFWPRPFIMSFYEYFVQASIQTKIVLAISFIIYIFLWSALFFVAILAIRPSIEKKTYQYFKRYYKHFLFFLIGIFLYLLIVFAGTVTPIAAYKGPLIDVLLLKEFRIGQYFGWPFIGALGIYYPLWLLYASLFYTDTQYSVSSYFKSWWLGLKFFVYNLLFMIIFIFIFAIAWETILSWPLILIVELPEIIKDIIITVYLNIFFLFFMCFLASFYTKRVHEQLNLYIKNDV